jgi:hypothetical protein
VTSPEPIALAPHHRYRRPRKAKGRQFAPGSVRFLGLLIASMAAGCGGGLPLLHPAQALEPGEVRVSAGFSANVASGAFASALRSALDEAAANAGTPGTDATYARGALVAASVAPGIAPLLAARVGVRSHEDAGLEYGGRSVRADARHSFGLSPHWSLSLGIGGGAVLYGRQAGGALPNVDLGRVHGWTADAPLLVGYASDGDLYMVWFGGRGGWEHVDIGSLSSASNAPALAAPPTSLSATRLWGGGLLGLAAGFRHVHVAVELDVSYANVSGDFGRKSAQVAGVTFTPASSLWWDF